MAGKQPRTLREAIGKRSPPIQQAYKRDLTDHRIVRPVIDQHYSALTGSELPQTC
jgi:hypothetical protein